MSSEGSPTTFDEERIVVAHLSSVLPSSLSYFDSRLNDIVYQLHRHFPTPEHANVGFYMTGSGSDEPFSVLMTGHDP